MAGFQLDQFSEDLRPVRPVDMGVVRRKPRKDRENSFLGEVAREQDPLRRQPDHLVAGGVSKPPRPQFDGAASEINRAQRAVINLIGGYKLRALERRGNMGAEGPEHANVAFALALEFVALRPVVVDLCRALENLRAETVLGMEMREREHQRPLSGDPLCRIQHLLAVGRTHAGVDHQRRVVADDDADVRHQRNAAVANHDTRRARFP